MNKSYLGFMYLMIFLFLVSCAKDMDEAYIPSFININSIAVTTTSEQGSSSSNFTDAWVFLDGADRGAYPLPSIIPLLAEGQHRVKIAPGIKLNGMTTTRVPYPLVEPVEMELELVKDSVQEISVACEYYSTSKFALVEGFELSNLEFKPTEFNTAEWRTSNTVNDPASFVFEGYHSGLGILDDDHSRFQVITKREYDQIPKGPPSFIELNFRTNTTVVVSYVPYNNTGVGESVDIIYLNPTDEWKKIYINLTSIISQDVNHYIYKFLISADHTNGEEETIVLIDNFKIVYREVE